MLGTQYQRIVMSETGSTLKPEKNQIRNLSD